MDSSKQQQPPPYQQPPPPAAPAPGPSQQQPQQQAFYVEIPPNNAGARHDRGWAMAVWAFAALALWACVFVLFFPLSLCCLPFFASIFAAQWGSSARDADQRAATTHAVVYTQTVQTPEPVYQPYGVQQQQQPAGYGYPQAPPPVAVHGPPGATATAMTMHVHQVEAGGSAPPTTTTATFQMQRVEHAPAVPVVVYAPPPGPPPPPAPPADPRALTQQDLDAQFPATRLAALLEEAQAWDAQHGKANNNGDLEKGPKFSAYDALVQGKCELCGRGLVAPGSSPGDVLVRRVGCGHIFHDQCISGHLTGTTNVCPTCGTAFFRQ